MTPRGSRQGRRGFTLVELLIAISIIALLAAITTGVAVALVGNRKSAITRDLLATMDRALDEYAATNSGAFPKYVPEGYRWVPGDGNDWEDYRSEMHVRRPDAAVFIRQATGFGAVDSVIRSIPERFLIVTRGGAFSGGEVSEGPHPVEAADLTPSVLDAWGSREWPHRAPNAWPLTAQSVIYYVHPDNDLAQDLYGRCANRRPYFLSAGPDNRYGLGSEIPGAGGLDSEQARIAYTEALENNIYSYEVDPLRTANLTEGFNRNVRNSSAQP